MYFYSGGLTDVLKEADAACYMAKEMGRSRVHVYRPDDAEIARRHGEMQWVARINNALEQNRFRLSAQPIVPIGAVPAEDGYLELLVSFQEESGRHVPPNTFLPAAERYNLSTKLDRWVIGRAITWLSATGKRTDRPSLCFINLSGRSIGDDEFLEFLIEKFEEAAIPPGRICFEVTETATITNLSTASDFIRALKELGCLFALDDFGSGLSSFAYLKNLPVDFLKIDGSFVKDIGDDPINLAMVNSINEIGHVMGKKTIAECVETEATLEKLREVGVDYAQGFYLGRPKLV